MKSAHQTVFRIKYCLIFEHVLFYVLDNIGTNIFLIDWLAHSFTINSCTRFHAEQNGFIPKVLYSYFLVFDKNLDSENKETKALMTTELNWQWKFIVSMSFQIVLHIKIQSGFGSVKAGSGFINPPSFFYLRIGEEDVVAADQRPTRTSLNILPTC